MYSYDIHGIVTVQSEGWLPELADFSTRDAVEKPSIFVRLGRVNSHQGDDAALLPGARRILYTEGPRRLGFAVEITVAEDIQVRVSRFLRRSPHVLYTNVVEPILRWAFVSRGYALVHGACIALHGQAYLITARTDTGKTTTVLRILSAERQVGFVADDLTLVSPDGRALTYPKPLTISQHTVQAVNQAALSRSERLMLIWQSRIHSRPSRRLALFLARTRLPMATINTIVQWLVPPPKYHIQRLIPGVKVTREAKLAGMFIIQRGGDGESVLESEEALGILFRNCEDAYGFPPYHAIEGMLSTANGHDLRPVEREIMRNAFRGCPAMLLSSSQLDWWKRIPALAVALGEQQA